LRIAGYRYPAITTPESVKNEFDEIYGCRTDERV
jgi:hypothetical protein